LRRRSDTGELHLLTTLTHFGTAVTVTELRLGAFLPVDGATASILGELERQYSDDAERGFSFRLLASLVYCNSYLFTMKW